MDRGYVYRPLTGNLRIKNKCQILARPLGEAYFRSMGDHSSVNLSFTIEETEVYSNESPDKDLVLVDITKAEPALSAALRQTTDFGAQILFLTGKPLKSVGTPVADRNFAFAGMTPGDVADLGVENITKLVVTDAKFVKGTHYEIDQEAGRIELIAIPDGADGDLEGTVSGTAGVLPAYGLMDQTQIRCSVLIRTNNKFGRNWELEFFICQPRPEGELPLGMDGDDFGEVTVNFRIFADPSQPRAFRYGRIRELPRRAA